MKPKTIAQAREQLRAWQQLPPEERAALQESGAGDVRTSPAQPRPLTADQGKDRQLELLTAMFHNGAQLELAKEAIAAYPRKLEAVHAAPKHQRASQFRNSSAEVAESLARAVDREQDREPGTSGHQAVMGSRLRYVQEEDLEALIPDGWGDSFTEETVRLGRRVGLPRLAVPLLSIAIWCSRLKEVDEKRGHVGAGAQLSSKWLARKLGCTTRWVNKLFARLDPLAGYRHELGAVRKANRKRAGRRPLREPPRPAGTPYIHRHPRIMKLSHVQQRNGSGRGEPGREVVWVDRTGKPRQWVHVRGVIYLSDVGEALLHPRALDELRGQRPGESLANYRRYVDGEHRRMRRNGTLIDLTRRVARIGWRVRARLAGRAKKVTAADVHLYGERIYSAPPFAGAG